MTFTCDKCRETACAEVTCGEARPTGILRGSPCSTKYRRCAAHGGEAGAMRSLKSHKGLYHPKTEASS